MIFEEISIMKNEGFWGFETISSLMSNSCKNVPCQKGVYFIMHDKIEHAFLDESVGGHFKGKNPTVGINKLEDNWVDGQQIIYIGQAGGGGKSKATLNDRLIQLLRFGNGEPVGHWGGRLVWQLKDNRNLNICWKATPFEDSREIEKKLIELFKNKYGKRPFANLQG